MTVAASATDAGIHRKITGSGTTTVMMSNVEMEDIIKAFKGKYWRF